MPFTTPISIPSKRPCCPSRGVPPPATRSAARPGAARRGGRAGGGFYGANRHVIAALLEGLGCAVTDLGILPDRFAAIRDALASAAAGNDLVISSGGMSTGDEDHVKAAVEALGRL